MKKIIIITILNFFFLVAVQAVSAGNNCAEDPWKEQGYKCIDINKNQGENCQTGLCPGPANIQCCQLTGAASAAGSSAFTGPILPNPSGDKSKCPEGYDGNCGNYSLNDLIRIAVNISRWILGISGSVLFAMFIYGGFTWILAAGSSEDIKNGKEIIKNAVIGLIIIFSAYTAINYILYGFGFAKQDGEIINQEAAVNGQEKWSKIK